MLSVRDVVHIPRASLGTSIPLSSQFSDLPLSLSYVSQTAPSVLQPKRWMRKSTDSCDQKASHTSRQTEVLVKLWYKKDVPMEIDCTGRGRIGHAGSRWPAHANGVLPPNNVTGVYELGIRHTRIYGHDQTVQCILTCRKDELFFIKFHQDPNQFHIKPWGINGRSALWGESQAIPGRKGRLECVKLGIKNAKCFLTGVTSRSRYQSAYRNPFCSATLGWSEEGRGASTAERVVTDGQDSPCVVEVVAIEEGEIDSASSTSGATLAGRASPGVGAPLSVEGAKSSEGTWKVSNKPRAISARPSFDPIEVYCALEKRFSIGECEGEFDLTSHPRSPRLRVAIGVEAEPRWSKQAEPRQGGAGWQAYHRTRK